MPPRRVLPTKIKKRVLRCGKIPDVGDVLKFYLLEGSLSCSGEADFAEPVVSKKRGTSTEVGVSRRDAKPVTEN